MQNGVRSASEQKYSSSSASAAPTNSGSSLSMAAPLTNGRSSSTAPTTTTTNPSSLFSKPTKLPPHDQLEPLQSLMPESPGLMQPPETPTKVEEILKMMTKQLVGPPLSKIAATPRTEIEVQQPNKKHVYAELPPQLFKPPMKPRKSRHTHTHYYLFCRTRAHFDNFARTFFSFRIFSFDFRFFPFFVHFFFRFSF